MKRPVKISPSLLAADFMHLGDEVRKMEDAGADMLHFDVMDAHFVPNLSMGVPVLASVRKFTTMYLDVHLMMDNPDKFLKAFADAGANGITVHLEVFPEPDEILGRIRDLGVTPGLVINPDMPVERLQGRVGQVDRLLLMSVFPGFGGQKFIPETLGRITAARKLLDASGREAAELQVDGGVTLDNAHSIVAAGADCLVAGTAVFAAADPEQAVKRMRSA